MKFSTVAAAILVGLASVGVSAQDAEQEAEQPKKEKKICRTDKATGSLTRRTRICMTAEQWRELNSRTYRGVSQMQGEGSGGQKIDNNPGAGG